MLPADTPAAEVVIDEPLVHRLLREQFPEWAGLALRPLANGWDNVIYRLGDDLTVRLPRRALAAPLIHFEQRWLPELATRLPLPVPAPVGCGVATEYFPWAWSVAPWFPGATALQEPPADPVATAQQLGEFVRALHVPGPADAPVNPYRGGPLAGREAVTQERLERLRGQIDDRRVREVWAEVISIAPYDGPPIWLHGDLHPSNVLVHQGRLSAVIDFGDMTTGDPATDIAAAWIHFPPHAREVFRAAVGDVDDATWARARGWALSLGLAYAAGSADNPPFARLGLSVIAAACAHP